MKIGSAAIIEGSDAIAGQGRLQSAITELVNFPYQPDTAAWVTKVSIAPTEVIAGAIAMWVPGDGSAGVYVGTDTVAPRREAAIAILQARFADQSARQTKWILRLTWAIAVLTLVMLGAVVVQIALPAPFVANGLVEVPAASVPGSGPQIPRKP
jgi:hypothetical protein